MTTAKHAVARAALAVMISGFVQACRWNTRWQVLSSDASAHAVSVMSLAFADGDRGWMATSGGALETRDGGRHWHLSAAGSGVPITAVQFLPGGRGWLAGSEVGERGSAIVFSTTDGGHHWTKSDVTTTSGLLDASFCDPNIGWAVSRDAVIATADGGAHWQQRWNLGAEGPARSIACQDAQSSWVVSSNGHLRHTETGGQAWQEPRGDWQGRLFRVRVHGNRVWGVGQQGCIVTGDPGGTNMRQLPTGSAATLLDVWVADRDGWAVGMEGTILATRDGGLTWTAERSPTSSDLATLFFLGPDHGWAAGRSMTVLRLR